MSRTSGRTDEGHGRLGSVLSGLVVALGCVLFLGGFAWGAIVYQPYTVPTESMAPTIKAGDRILAERIDGSDVERGDVVVFKQESWGDMLIVKRVVAVGGDTVACCTDEQADRQRQEDRRTVSSRGPGRPSRPRSRPSRSPRAAVPARRRAQRLARLHGPPHGGLQRHGAAQRGEGPRRRRGLAHGRHAGRVPRTSRRSAPISSPGPLRLVLAAVVAGAVLVLGGGAYGPIAKRVGRRRGRTGTREPALAG